MQSDPYSARLAEQCVLPGSLRNERVLRSAQAARFIGFSRPMRRAGKLPPAIRISERRIGWRVRDLIEYLKAQPLANTSTSTSR
jgi:predicted DNA-binding transcriptional regulator AlpA